MSGPATAPDLSGYDRILVAMSGGKDSVGALLAVLDAGADPTRVELHHHLVDGRGPAFMDWPSTEGWCGALAAAFRLPLYLSWREGGFHGEMLREDRPASPVRFEVPGRHALGRAGGGSGQRVTRLRFPQVGAVTSGRWCSAILKGTAGLTAFKAYVAESRSRGATWTVISEAAVHDAERRSRALGDASPVTAADLWNRVVRDMASKPYKALATDLAGSARADRSRAVDAFIRQSHRLQAMVAAGRDPGQEARRHVRDLAASREVAGSQVALGGALRGVDAGLAGVAREVAVHERGQRVRAFMQQQAAGTLPGAGSDTGVRRMAQAEGVRKQLARHVAGLDEALRRNDQGLRGLGQDVMAHLQGVRVEAETARRELEAVVRRPSSPSPGGM